MTFRNSDKTLNESKQCKDTLKKNKYNLDGHKVNFMFKDSVFV